MIVTCISLNKSSLIGKSQDDSLAYLTKNMFTIGVPINNIYTTTCDREQLLSCLKFTETSNLVIILGTDDSKENFIVKNAIADHLKVSIEKNETAVKEVENYIYKHGNRTINNIENEYYLPKMAVCLPSPMSHMQGFACFKNNIIVFLPGDTDSVKYLFNNSLFPIVTKELKVAYQSMVIKLFGISEKQIIKNLQDLIDANPEILINTLSENLDTSLIIRYSMLLEKEKLNNYISTIYERLRQFIYSDEDVSLYNMALDLLTISNTSLSICETITGGNIFNKFNQCLSPSKYLINSDIVINNENMAIKLLNCNGQVFKSSGFVSVESTYELASALLDKNPNDLVLVTCGNIDNENHTCFIAVGDNDGIHVYKNTCLGSNSQVVETVSNCAVFYLIKKLKQNDLFFNKIYV